MSMKQFEGNIKSITDTPFGYTLTMIGGKWRLVILYWLVEYGVVRFNELQRLIGGITYKTLSAQLRYTKINYDYTGSNAFFADDGMPIDINDAMAVNATKSASNLMGYLRYRY